MTAFAIGPMEKELALLLSNRAQPRRDWALS